MYIIFLFAAQGCGKKDYERKAFYLSKESDEANE